MQQNPDMPQIFFEPLPGWSRKATADGSGIRFSSPNTHTQLLLQSNPDATQQNYVANLFWQSEQGEIPIGTFMQNDVYDPATQQQVHDRSVILSKVIPDSSPLSSLAVTIDGKTGNPAFQVNEEPVSREAFMDALAEYESSMASLTPDLSRTLGSYLDSLQPAPASRLQNVWRDSRSDGHNNHIRRDETIDTLGIVHYCPHILTCADGSTRTLDTQEALKAIAGAEDRPSSVSADGEGNSGREFALTTPLTPLCTPASTAQSRTAKKS